MTPRRVEVRFLDAAGAELGRAGVPAGSWLPAAARRAGVRLVFDCDGMGLCATCRVHVEEGAEHLPPVAPAERAQLGEAVAKRWRLGCLLRVGGAVTVRLPPGEWAYPPELQR